MTRIGETPRDVFTRWLADGQTLIAVFENQDLGHSDLGRRICLSYDQGLVDVLVVGKATAPDHAQIGLGWRYILVLVTQDVDEALAALAAGEPQDAPGGD
jgi:hypothetical protein